MDGIIRKVAAMAGSVALSVAGIGTAQADDQVSGRIVDLRNRVPVSGLQVTVYEHAPPSGVSVSAAGSASTASDGTFVIDVIDNPDVEDYLVNVDGGDDYQSGWLTRNGFLADTSTGGDPVSASADIGDITIIASHVRGRVVDAVSGGGVPFVLVIAYLPDYSTRIGWTITDLRGRFNIDIVPRDEITMWFCGTLTWHENGWHQGSFNTVVPSMDEAATTSPGDQGDVALEAR